MSTLLAMAAIVVAIDLVQLTAPTGHAVFISPSEVSSLREPVDVSGGHWARGTRCVVIMTNGKFNAVTQDCATVRNMIGESALLPARPASGRHCVYVCGESR
jgi:hypothetical protein